jgi:hypothetical protein
LRASARFNKEAESAGDQRTPAKAKAEDIAPLALARACWALSAIVVIVSRSSISISLIGGTACVPKFRLN